MAKVLSKIETEDILEELKAGIAIAKVAAAHDVSQERIRAIRDSSGEAEMMTATSSSLTTEDKKRIKQLYTKDNMTIAQIVDIIGIKDVWAVMEFCESCVFDSRRVKNNKTAILKKFWNGWSNEDIADYYNVKVGAIAKVTTPVLEKALLHDYKSGISIADLLDMYDMSLDTLQTAICKAVRHEIKGV